MKKLLSFFVLLILITGVHFGAAHAAATPAPQALIVVLPVINSSADSDAWILQHVQSILSSRFPLAKYRYADSGQVADFLRNSDYVAGFGQLPDKETTEKLARHFGADAVIGLKIVRLAYQTSNAKITAIYGKEQVTSIIEAAIYSAKDGDFLAYTSRKTVDKKLGLFTPYEKEETITAGLDLCLDDILGKVAF